MYVLYARPFPPDLLALICASRGRHTGRAGHPSWEFLRESNKEGDGGGFVALRGRKQPFEARPKTTSTNSADSWTSSATHPVKPCTAWRSTLCTQQSSAAGPSPPNGHVRRAITASNVGSGLPETNGRARRIVLGPGTGCSSDLWLVRRVGLHACCRRDILCSCPTAKQASARRAHSRGTDSSLAAAA